jgi:hypothetical protein
MIDSIIAYDIEQLERRKILADARNWHNSLFITDLQKSEIERAFATNLFTPSFFMRILLFLAGFVGLITTMGPLALMFSGVEEGGLRVLSLLLGFGILTFTELVLIRQKFHYKSGITEAGIYSGLIFVGLGVLWVESDNTLAYLIGACILAFIAAFRYLNLVALAIALFFMGWAVFFVCYNWGGWAQALIPFIMMALFGAVFAISQWSEKRIGNVVFDDQFIVSQAFSLLAVYVAGNYFVVRELSVSMMDLYLVEGQDVPFAFLFYFFTAAIPIFYVVMGIKRQSLLFLRVGLIAIALSVVTFKYYFSLGMPVVTITLSGAVLIALALAVMKYLKQPKYGFTRESMFKDKWMTQNVTAFIASQTLGGNKTGLEGQDDNLMQGGKFGGSGAGSNW